MYINNEKIIDNAIEIQYRKLQDNIDDGYISLYANIPYEKLKIVFSTLHARLIFLFNLLNSKLPTHNESEYFGADSSRNLIDCIESITQLQKSLLNTSFEFCLDKYYQAVIDQCNSFLCKYRGSLIPPNTNKIELYYAIPIFIFKNIPIRLDTPKISVIDRVYIKEVADRAWSDIGQGNFDSAITKSRTLIEETFCYVIELQGEDPSDSGDISKLYKQVKQLYNMHADKSIDERINMLLSGLEKILAAISQMRNVGSDSHGLGQKRRSILAHHARLFVNSAITMAEFILSVGENKKFKE